MGFLPDASAASPGIAAESVGMFPGMSAGTAPGMFGGGAGNTMFASDGGAGGQHPHRGASPEIQSLLGMQEKLRHNMLSAVNSPAQAPQAMPQFPHAQGFFAAQPQNPVFLPQVGMPVSYVSPAPVVSSQLQPASPVPAQTSPAPAQTSPAPAETSPTHAQTASNSLDMHGIDSSQREFQKKLQTMRGHLIPELRARRSELQGALHSVDAQIAEIQQLCLEARRDGESEFEALKAHLSATEHLKLAVLGRERDERAALVDGITDTFNQVEAAAAGSGNPEVVAGFLQKFPELHAKAQSLWSRSGSLPQVEVGVGDIPFEARAKSDKLRKFAVMGHLQFAKDVCLWHLELQRRQLAHEAMEAGACLQHLEALLERYSEELAFVCYFCAERFSAGAANSRCLYNHSPRAGSPVADPRIPSHVWGVGTHFWVPCSHNSGAKAGFESPVGGIPPRMRFGIDDHIEVLSAPSGGPSRQSTPPRGHPFWEAPYAAGHSPPWSAGFAPPGGYSAGPSTDLLLRKIAQACERNGVDIRSAFRAFDANGDGFISPQEFRHAISQLRIGASDEDVAWLVSRLDVNADGMVSYEEFLGNHFHAARDPRVAGVGAAFVEHFAGHDAAAQSLWQRVARVFRDRGVPLRQAFALFDADGDGIISRQDLVQAFTLMHLGLSDSDVERMMRDIDVNEDGKVSIHEFVNRLSQSFS